MRSFKKNLEEYSQNSTLHGVKFLVDEENTNFEKIFWFVCICASWFGAFLLISAALDAFRNNAITFVVETSFRDWNTNFPAIVVCETKNMERIQEVADELWTPEHDFILEEVLNEISYFRGECYHVVHECGEVDPAENCFYTNFSYYAKLVRSSCEKTIESCFWNDKSFDCCKHFKPMETELGTCYALNSIQSQGQQDSPKLNMLSNKRTGPGILKMNILTEANIYTIGEEDVPTLITPKTDILSVSPMVSYSRYFTIRNIENAEGTRDVSVEQRNCRFSFENYLNVHNYYSYSACTVQCRKNKQMNICNCTSHLTPNTPMELQCNMTGLRCLNSHYEDLSIVVAQWSHGKKGLKCDCLPSCTEIDTSIVHDVRDNLDDDEKPISKVELGLFSLPTERYKRNVVRGKLDLVVSMGGTFGLFVGASLLSFVEIFYYLTVRPCGSMYLEKKQQLQRK